MREPFNRNEARKRIQEISRDGVVVFSRHAEEELAKDDLTAVDARNVLRAGKILEEPEWVNGTWRYRVHTARMTVVVAFVSEASLRVITAWRKK